MKILIVEDHESLRRGLKEMILRILAPRINEEIVVVEAEDGQIATEILQRATDISLILTDFRMPRMNGVALSVWVRDTHPSIPIILHSTDKKAPEGHKADLFLEKGSIFTLADAIFSLLSK